MSFANPLGLLGLLVLPLIAALHLMRARRRRYRTSSLALWSFLQPEVRGSLPRRLPLTPLLAADLLAAVLISLAIAGPRLPQRVTNPPARLLVAVLDGSTSMNAVDVPPGRFEAARSELFQLLGGLRADDRAAVILFTDHARLVGDTRSQSLSELLDRTRALRAGGGAGGLEEALAAARALQQPGLSLEIHLFTDTAYPAPAADALALPLRWHIYGSNAENQAVLSLAAQQISPDGAEVFARLVNMGSQPAARDVTLTVDGQTFDRTTVALGAGETRTVTWRVAGRPALFQLRLAGQDALPEDDRADAVLTAPLELRAALVGEKNPDLERALRALTGVRLTLLAPQEYQAGMDYDLTVFTRTLPAQWPTGTVLVFDPPSGQSLLPVSGQVQMAAAPVFRIQPGFEGLDFSGVAWEGIWNLQDRPAGMTAAIQADGQPLLLRGQVGASQIFVWLSDLSAGNLTRHPAFPALVAALAENARAAGWPLQPLAPGDLLALPPQEKYASIQIVPPRGPALSWDRGRGDTFRLEDGPGVYRIETISLSGVPAARWLAVNAGDAAEAQIAPRAWGQTVVSAPDRPAPVETRLVSLSAWLLGAAVLVLLVEAWLAWR